MTDPRRSSFEVPPPGNPASPPPPPPGKAGCFTTILYGIGFLSMFFAVLGYILNLFDYELVIHGSEMGRIDLDTAIALIVVGIFFVGVAFAIDKIAKVIQRRKNDQ